MNIRRRCLAGLLPAVLALVAAAPAHANGIGDLYAATPGGVTELYVHGARTVTEVPVKPRPTALAFSPDGRSLYASGGRRLVHIDIETISADGELQLPAAASALAFPGGRELVIALPARRTLGLLEGPNAQVTETQALPGAADLLAADRRDPRVVAATRGGSWLAVYHTGDRELTTSSVEGRIQAIAVDRDRGAALVATAKPDRLTRLDLRDLRVVATVPLPAPPAAVAATLSGGVVAADRTIWSVGTGETRRIASAQGRIAHLATSDEGRVILAAGSERIEAFPEAGGGPLRTLEVADVAALAAIPAPSSVSGDGGRAPAGPGDGKGELPATSTVLERGARWIADRRDLVAIVLVALAIGIGSLAAGSVLLRRGRRTG